MTTTVAPIRLGTRLETRLDQAAAEGRKIFSTYTMACDPDFDTALEIMCGLPDAGVDIIELGVPFTDPMADGPTIQAAGQRALAAGGTVARTLEIVRRFRENDNDTPVVLMSYYNPIYAGEGGVQGFLDRASRAGVDGLIVVDLPPEEDDELCIPAQKAGLNFIRLATPTTDDKRLPMVARNTSGYVYYVSIAGVTGAAAPAATDVGPSVERIRRATGLPVIVGFGIATPEDARAIASIADGCIVGSAIVRRIGEGDAVDDILDFVRGLAQGTHVAG